MTAHELLRKHTGLDLSAQVAQRAVASRLAQLGLAGADADTYLHGITPDELKALIELVVVPESWMFRDAESFAAVSRFVRARLTDAPERLLRVLSLPCAAGEEPYSIAMALADAGVPRRAFHIDAVDLSDAALERARAGRYTRNAFRGAELSFRERHFTPVGADYQISETMREQVNFSQGNLLEIDTAANAGRYDIVFCRNLLIYFDDATSAAAIARLRLMLADDGLLFAGYAEVPAFCRHGFVPLRAPGAFALTKERRDDAQRKTAPAAPQVAPSAVRAPRVMVTPAAPPPAPRAAAPSTDPVLILQQASRLADQGDYDGAAAACHAVLALDAGSADACYLLGLVSECAGKPGVAADYWRRCVYLQPEHYEALCHLALLAETNGDAAQAEAFRQRAARLFNRRDERRRAR